MQILIVFGTRPEAIKMAPLVQTLKSSQILQTKVCVTGQHRQMLDQVLSLFEIVPDIDLDIMQRNQDLADVTSRVLLGLRDTIKSQPVDAILVHGDTTTALASAMAGFYLGVPVGHVEAGLRTYDMHAPFPEEFNRQVITKVAKWHFAPTALSRDNLLKEGVPESSITVTGNTVIDALKWTIDRMSKDASRRARLVAEIDKQLSFDWQVEPYILMTGHRRENFGDGFIRICEAIRDISIRYPDAHIVYPVHLNPNVRQPVHALLGSLDHVHLVEPMEYEQFSLLLSYCRMVLTDSGGIQEEAPSLGKPVLVMRDTTERPEALMAGTVELVGTDSQKIVSTVSRLMDDEIAYRKMSEAHNPYGDGHACQRIVSVLENWAQSRS